MNSQEIEFFDLQTNQRNPLRIQIIGQTVRKMTDIEEKELMSYPQNIGIPEKEKKKGIDAIINNLSKKILWEKMTSVFKSKWLLTFQAKLKGAKLKPILAKF